MKQLIFTLALFLTATYIHAQQDAFIPCGYDFYVQDLIEENPAIEDAIKATFDRDKSKAQLRSDEVYTIPVVVHIVYQDSSQLVPDSTVYAVMEKVSKDFMRENEDADNIRDIFKDRVASANINFEVHAINRVLTDATFDFGIFTGLPDHVKLSAEGGSDAYQPEKYMNIWVCNLEGGLLGYAYPPAGLHNWPEGSSAEEGGLDGVVINTAAFSVFDTITVESAFGGSAEVIIRGRTVTHEIGHYLGLRHIWGDGLAALGIPACDEDDGIEDTPNQGLPSDFMCDTTLNTCIDEIDDLPDMIENFMDYAEETCENSFTQGQVDHMRSVLENERRSLIDSTTVGVHTPEPDYTLDIYPNPARDYLNIRLKDVIQNNFSIEIYDMQGRQVYREKILSKHKIHRLDIDKLEKGVYVLRILSKDFSHSEKFILM